MAKELRFNIVEFPSSFVPNEQAFHLMAQPHLKISPHLGYASSHWDDRIPEPQTLDSDLLEMLCALFRTHFLYWLKVMSFLGLSPVKLLKNLDAGRVRSC